MLPGPGWKAVCWFRPPGRHRTRGCASDGRFLEDDLPLVSTVVINVPKSVRFDPAVPSRGVYSKEIILAGCESGVTGVTLLFVIRNRSERLHVQQVGVVEAASPPKFPLGVGARRRDTENTKRGDAG